MNGRSETAVQIDSDGATILNQRAAALHAAGRVKEALGVCEQALQMDPAHAEILNNRGVILHDLGEVRAAIASFEQAIAADPRFVRAHANIAAVLRQIGDTGAALAQSHRAVTLAPGSADAHWNLSLCQLQLGRYPEGFHSFEWRKRKAQPFGLREGPEPEWDLVSDLSDRHILIHAEQGMGDAIMFARYVPMVAARAKQVTFEVHPGLVPLLRTVHPDLPVFELGQFRGTLDCHCPLMSLPLAFGTTLDTVPATVPYLTADPARIARWAERIGTHGFRIGICWRGNPFSGADAGRSLYVSEFAPLAAIPGVRLISLQKGAGTEQLLGLANRFRVEDPGAEFDAGPGAFLDTAAIMHCLDLVVTVDTAVGHLAGALARPVWIALKVGHDWRWLTGRTDTPWYPTARLFRQQTAGDWPSVFEPMADEIRRLMDERA